MVRPKRFELLTLQIRRLVPQVSFAVVCSSFDRRHECSQGVLAGSAEMITKACASGYSSVMLTWMSAS
jgi:hypothetical protein